MKFVIPPAFIVCDVLFTPACIEIFHMYVSSVGTVHAPKIVSPLLFDEPGVAHPPVKCEFGNSKTVAPELLYKLTPNVIVASQITINTCFYRPFQ